VPGMVATDVEVPVVALRRDALVQDVAGAPLVGSAVVRIATVPVVAVRRVGLAGAARVLVPRGQAPHLLVLRLPGDRFRDAAREESRDGRAQAGQAGAPQELAAPDDPLPPASGVPSHGRVLSGQGHPSQRARSAHHRQATAWSWFISWKE